MCECVCVHVCCVVCTVVCRVCGELRSCATGYLEKSKNDFLRSENDFFSLDWQGKHRTPRTLTLDTQFDDVMR